MTDLNELFFNNVICGIMRIAPHSDCAKVSNIIKCGYYRTP